MSSIDKMAIMGVRSFDSELSMCVYGAKANTNHQNETIQFFSPLTLIVGHNGSGKTTIIECLKYTTTGQMPPFTNKGSAFVHDPDLCGEKEVLSQVKLSFNNTNGEKMICTRSLQLTVKEKSRSMKTLDGTLTIMRNGERSTISTRCADLDLQMPLSLGVSKAILEYVIFCHQEESTWPLSEPSVLKKRFDEIFEAVKYTKALDQIKSVRKDQMLQVKVDSALLAQSKKEKEDAARIRSTSEDILRKVDTYRVQVRSLDEQMTKALDEQNELFRSGEEFERVIAELDKFKHEREIMRDTHKDLSRNITIYQESDAELREMQANFGKNMDAQDLQVKELQQERSTLEGQLNDLRSKLNENASHEGQLRAEAEQYDKHIFKRQDLVKSVSRSHNIRGFDMTLDEDQIAEFKIKLTLAMKAQSAKLDRVRREGRDQENEINNDLQKHLNRHTEQESRQQSARNQIRSTEAKLQQLQTQLDNHTTSQAEVASLDRELINAEREILSKRSEIDKGDWDRKIQSYNSQIRVNEDKMDGITKEINVGNRQADSRAKLGLLQSDRARKQDMLQSLLNTHKASFLQVTGKEIKADSVEVDCRLAIASTDAELEDAEKQNDMASKDVSQIEAQINVTQDTLRDKRQEERKLREVVCEVFEDPETAEEEFGRLENELEKAQGNFYQAQYALKFFERAATFGNDRNCCQLCHRDFDEDLTLMDFLSLLDTKKSMVPKHLANAQEVIDGLTSDLTNAKAVQPARSALSAISEIIPQLAAQLKEQQTTLGRLVAASDDATSRVQQAKALAKSITALDRAAAEMGRLNRELVTLAKQISNLESELSATGSSRSVDEMQADLTSLQNNNKRIKEDIAQLIDERERHRTSLTVLEGRRRDLQLSQSEQMGHVRDKENLQVRIDECIEARTKALEEIKEAEEQISRDQPETARLRGDLESLRIANTEAESHAQKELGLLTTAYNSLESLDSDINGYLLAGGPDALRKSRLMIGDVQRQIETMEKNVGELTTQISAEERKNSDLRSTERNINDNLRLRKVQRDISRLGQSINALEAKNAVRDREQYILDSQRLKTRYSSLVQERAGLLGEITQLDNQIREKQEQLNTRYKDADEVYRKQLIEVRTMEKANEDLDKYGKALDNAIMKYHSLKMEEINKIVDELWKATYCGTDVDSISLKSEGEAKGNNRSYNYRVCMIKGDAELDMRGRCSAGQKVLAAIIIRLALAECFGINCGILALDEPTTNLDRENIESLAKSLANIISVRRSQKNFQLIVITHDEEFLRMMGCSDYCDYYYRISRNEYQKSIISRQRVSTVL